MSLRDIVLTETTGTSAHAFTRCPCRNGCSQNSLPICSAKNARSASLPRSLENRRCRQVTPLHGELPKLFADLRFRLKPARWPLAGRATSVTLSSNRRTLVYHSRTRFQFLSILRPQSSARLKNEPVIRFVMRPQMLEAFKKAEGQTTPFYFPHPFGARWGKVLFKGKVLSMSKMSERGIYLTAPDGRVVAELRLDSKLRARQRSLRPWQPHQDVLTGQAVPEPLNCKPSNPSKLCQV